MRFFPSNKRTSLFSRALPFLDRWMTPVGNRFQRWAVPRLSRIERQLSRRQKILAITLFCLIAGGYSTSVLVEAFSGPPARPPGYLTPTSISRPLPLPHPDSASILRVPPSHPYSLLHHSPIKK